MLVDNDYNGNFTPTVPDFDFDDNDDISHLFQGKSVPLPQVDNDYDCNFTPVPDFDDDISHLFQGKSVPLPQAKPQVQQVQVHRAALAGLN